MILDGSKRGKESMEAKRVMDSHQQIVRKNRYRSQEIYASRAAEQGRTSSISTGNSWRRTAEQPELEVTSVVDRSGSEARNEENTEVLIGSRKAWNGEKSTNRPEVGTLRSRTQNGANKFSRKTLHGRQYHVHDSVTSRYDGDGEHGADWTDVETIKSKAEPETVANGGHGRSFEKVSLPVTSELQLSLTTVASKFTQSLFSQCQPRRWRFGVPSGSISRSVSFSRRSE